jgi:pyruvate dehydrogenase (quinone)
MIPDAGSPRSGAVATTLRRLGSGGCAARTAGEFGHHPDTAVSRMCWALATIRMVYPTTPAPALVDVRTVREELSLPPKLTYDQIKGFTLYATRTILSGEGSELIELTRANLRELEVE